MSRATQTYFTSDWHIGHANSLIFDKRPFKDINHMHRVLVNNYNACVRPQDKCYFLGDVGMSKSETLSKIIKELNGTKILVVGNHDKGYQSMYDIGFDVVMNGAVLYVAGERVTLSHCPLMGVFREDISGMRGAKETDNWHGEHKNQAYSFINEGQFHLHGHIHSGPANSKKKIDGRQFDVGVPANDFRPVSISTIESWIARTRLGHFK